MITYLRAGAGYTNPYLVLTGVYSTQWRRAGNYCWICGFVVNRAEPDSRTSARGRRVARPGPGYSVWMRFAVWIWNSYKMELNRDQKRDVWIFAPPYTSNHWPYEALEGEDARWCSGHYCRSFPTRILFCNDSGGVRGMRGRSYWVCSGGSVRCCTIGSNFDARLWKCCIDTHWFVVLHGLGAWPTGGSVFAVNFSFFSF